MLQEMVVAQGDADRQAPRDEKRRSWRRLAARTPDLLFSGTRVSVISDDEPMEGVGRPWFECSLCKRRRAANNCRDKLDGQKLCHFSFFAMPAGPVGMLI